jgi:hypothetical protein
MFYKVNGFKLLSKGPKLIPLIPFQSWTAANEYVQQSNVITDITGVNDVKRQVLGKTAGTQQQGIAGP